MNERPWEIFKKPKPEPPPEEIDHQVALGRRYDELLAEKEKIQVDLKQFDARDFSIQDEHLYPDQIIKEITDKWLELVRKETQFLQPLDDLGIIIFTDDLEYQPGFPKEEIVFNSPEVRRREIVELQATHGHAYADQPLIEINNPKPSLREQIFSFLRRGVVDNETAALIHELIHRAHLDENPKTDILLSEVQAHFSGIFYSGSHFSITEIAKSLSQPKDKGGTYRYNLDQTLEAVTALATLYGLGMNNDEINTLVIQSEYSEEEKKFIPLSEVVDRALKNSGLTEIDAQALDDLYRLRFNNERQKAQLLLLQTVSERFTLEERRQAHVLAIRRSIAYPTYYKEGKPWAPEGEWPQNAVCPVDKDFPYNPDGKRSAVVFGFFPTERHSDRPPTFNIGRWEAEGTTASTTLAQTPAEIEKYLGVLRQQAPIIDLDQKAMIFSDYAERNHTAFPLIKPVLDALISKGEIRQILQTRTPIIIERLTSMLEEISPAHIDPINLRGILEKLKIYQESLDYYESFLGSLDITAEEVDPNLAKALQALKERLLKIKEEYRVFEQMVNK